MYNIHTLINTGINLLNILVPVLVTYLVEPDRLSASPAVVRALHDLALQKLVDIGPLYPAQFRAVLQGAPDLRMRLEVAVKGQHLRASQLAAGGGKASSDGGQSALHAQSKIKLKTDFSNFIG